VINKFINLQIILLKPIFPLGHKYVTGDWRLGVTGVKVDIITQFTKPQ